MGAQAERDSKHDACVAAHRRAEFLNAKCENLLAALENSTLKQADAVLERDAHKERVARLESDIGKLRWNIDDVRGVPGGVSLASTIASAAASDGDLEVTSNLSSP